VEFGEAAAALWDGVKPKWITERRGEQIKESLNE